MIRSFSYVFICTFFLCQPTWAQSFFSSDNYWNGKTAYEKADYDTAFKFWEESANQGDGAAQGFVAALYHGGQGIEKDYQKAMVWYKKAALQGIAQAQLGIGSLYGDGKGVEKDNVKARMWFSISLHNGNERADQYVKRITHRMTEDEIKKADDMALAWVKANPKPKPKPITKKKSSPKTTVQTTKPMDKGDLELKLTAVKDMLAKGLISKNEAAAKRKQILDRF